MKLDEFNDKFQKLRAKGFIKTKRPGPTGIGYTLETELGIKENNIASPDLGEIELKAHRHGQNTLITLFTFNRKVWKINPLEAIKKYGSFDKNNRKGLYNTMTLVPNSAGLFLHLTDKSVSVRSIDGTIIVEWGLDVITAQFIKKIPALMLVSAFSEERDGIEYFHFSSAQLMQGTSPQLLLDRFKAEHLVVDLRLHDKGTKSARNHGTGFRAYESSLPYLFSNITNL